MSVKQYNSLWALMVFTIGLGFTSCEVINPEEDIPSYIYIDSIKLNSSYNSPSSITDAWVYINDNINGVYELPATIPVLEGGPTNVKVFAGIKMNGISLTRIPYPCFDLYSEDTELIRDSIIEIKPVVDYKGTTRWEENFEDIGFTLQSTSSSDTSVIRETDPSIVFQGTGCGRFTLGTSQNIFSAISSSNFQLPKGSTPVFLELHYKCNNTFAVGITSNTPTNVEQITPSLVINPKDEWNRIYINLTNEVSAQAQAIDYNIYFYMERDFGNETPEVFIDNIRLIHL